MYFPPFFCLISGENFHLASSFSNITTKFKVDMTSTDENEQLVQEIVGNVLSESVKEDQLQDMEENQQIDFAGKMDHDIVEVEGQITVCDENGCALDSPTEEEEKKEEHSGEEVAQIADEIGGLSLCDDDDNKIDAVAAAPTTDAVAEAPTSDAVAEAPTTDAVAEAPTTDAVAEAPTTEQKATDGHVYDEPLANNEGKADNHPPPPEEEEQKEKMLVHAVVDDQTPNVVDDHTHATASDALPSLPPLSEPTNNTADNTYSNEANEIVSPTALEPKLLATSDEEEHQQQKEDALMANLSSGSGAAGEGTTAFNAVTPPPVSTVVPVEGQLQTEHQLRQHQQQAELCGAKAVHQQQNNGASSNRESVANDTDASSPRQIVSAKGGAEHSGGKTTHDGGSAGGKATEQKAKTKMCSIL